MLTADGTPFCHGDGWVEIECLVSLTAHWFRVLLVCQCQVVAWPSPSTGTLMEGNLPPERYIANGTLGPPSSFFCCDEEITLLL